uniref:asparagine synthase (glutamine-hydrolyzing) n=1 Tax=viral metagenome TaxID=1070528 RepID=A0A6C0CPQ3_9ZZZZ
MCGIFAIINKSLARIDDKILSEAVVAGAPRGPEQTETSQLQEADFFFHRLAINGLDKLSMQPISIGNVTLICNGEIYNYRELYDLHPDITPKTNSDCEIIIHMYNLYGMKRTLQMLDGVFAFALHIYDYYGDSISDKLYFGRDPFGVRPLYLFEATDKKEGSFIALASELKVLSKLTGTTADNNISPVKPGTYTKLEKPFKVHSRWQVAERNQQYFSLQFHPNVLKNIFPGDHAIISACQDIYKNLITAVKKRIVGTTDRPVACLLSGGLDSSLIAAIVSKFVPELHTFSIGMPGSKDLEYARVVASHINSVHHEVILSKDEFFNAIPNVIYNIESFDTTTVRASVGNYLIGQYISHNHPHKVIFNGDGSDELTGGYIYMLVAPNDIEFDNECKRLLEDIHTFDVLRSDRSISSNGLEPRTPFLDKTFVTEYLNIPAAVRNPRSSYNTHCQVWDRHANYYKSKGLNDIAQIIRSRPEKLLLRYAIDSMESNLLPPQILWRSKEAFSDGVSGEGESWYEVITNKLHGQNEDLSDYTKFATKDHMPPTTVEQLYYRRIYSQFFPNTDKSIPYFWMPKYVEATDASARTLAHYQSNN